MDEAIRAIKQKYNITDDEARKVAAAVLVTKKAQQRAGGARVFDRPSTKAPGQPSGEVRAGGVDAGDLMGLLGGLLGGGQQQGSQGGQADDLMGLLGGLLGGGQQQQGSQGGVDAGD